MGDKKIIKTKRLNVALQLCTDLLDTVADRLRYARLNAEMKQDTLATKIGIDRATIIRYENGQVAEMNMNIEWLMQIAVICGMDKYFCCNEYHMF